MRKSIPSTFIALLVAFSAVGQTSIYSSEVIGSPKEIQPITKVSYVQYADEDHDHTHGQDEKCAQHSKTEALMEANPAYRAGVEAFLEQNRAIIEEFESGERSAPPVYTIPIVFHVIHKGENVGSGTNISDAQIESTIDALNRDYRRTSDDGGIALGAGPDTEIQFCLAGVDPQGNPHSGINRVNGTSVGGYSSNGITSGNEESVKALSKWDNRYYLNIWVVSEIEGNGADVSNPNSFGGGVLGYAYLPIANIQFMSNIDGIVALNLCVGNDPNGSNGFRLWGASTTNRTLTHEIGHFLGLAHPFSDSNPFSCTNGDGIGDTPNAQQVSLFNCNYTGNCSGQMIENYMDYAPEQCQDRFTNGQTSVMRATLTGSRSELVNTNNCGSISSNDYDAGISAIIAPSGALCSTTFTPQVTLTNYGSNTLTSVQIAYAVDGQAQTPFNWTGNLATGASISFTLPPVTSTAGAHTFTSNVVSGTLNGNNADEDGSNNGSTSSFNIGSGGTGVTITIELDCWGEETTWEIRNASNAVVASGGPYTNDLPGGAGTQVATACLDNGCYDFNIFDSEGDGLYGSQWSNCDVDGDYMIVDDSQNMLVQMTASQGDFGASATHNFCIGGGSNPGTPECGILAAFDGQFFAVNPIDEPSFAFEAIDEDGETVSADLPGYTSNWMAFFEEVAPGDTNRFVGVTSWHADNTAPADNWLTFGPVTMLDEDGELRWKHVFANNDFRDGYEVLVGTTGTAVANFASADVVYSIIDNDPSTDGDTDWTQQTVSLPASSYANQSLYFAIHHRSLDQLILYIDDIEVEGCTSLTVGVEDEETEFNISVFPNPSSNNFTFQYKTEAREEISFEMFNSVGQKVWDYSVNDQPQGIQTIKTAGMSAGVYTLVVKGESFNVSERLILTK